MVLGIAVMLCGTEWISRRHSDAERLSCVVLRINRDDHGVEACESARLLNVTFWVPSGAKEDNVAIAQGEECGPPIGRRRFHHYRHYPVDIPMALSFVVSVCVQIRRSFG